MVGALTALGLSVGISGLAIGIGASQPDFKADNAARAATGPGAILFMVVALVFVAAVLALLAWPVLTLLVAEAEGAPIGPGQWIGIAACGLAAAALCGAMLVLPLRWAAPRLWRRSLA